MDLNKEYRRALDEAFARHVSDWGELSPLDPMKILADSVAQGLGEAERRQRRVVEATLDTLPSLFGFEPKPAVPPSALFVLTPASKAVAPVKLATGTRLPFREGNDTLVAVPIGEVSLEPVHRFQVQATASAWQARFWHPGGTQITLHFTGSRQGPSPVVRVRTRSKDGDWRSIPEKALRCEDGTSGLARPGYIRFSAAESGQLLFPAGGSEVEIEWQFSSALPKGELLPNVIACHVISEQSDVTLGTLKGESWEEVPLFESILSPPDTVALVFPDDRQIQVERASGELLRLRHLDSERISRGYFYDGSRHALIFPCADSMVGAYSSGARLLASRVSLAPSRAMPSASAQPSLGDLSAVVESARPLSRLADFEPRETAERFVARFFSSLKTVTMPAKSLVASDAEAAVLSSSPAVRAVEIAFDADRRELSAFVLTSDPSGPLELALPESVRLSAQEALEAIVPLDVTCHVLPFRRTALQLEVTLTIALSEQRLGYIDSEKISSDVQRIIRKTLMPPPYGSLSAGTRLTREEILRAASDGLASVQGDNSPLRRKEVVAAHGLIVHGPTARYLEEISRAPGELLWPQASVELQVRAAELSSDGPMRMAPRLVRHSEEIANG